jgi:AcrR family transcriptional regulator
VTVRQRLIEAAYSCVARDGMAKTTIEDIAREAGVSRPTVYRYFPGGKDALFRDVVAWEAGRVIGDLARDIGPHTELAAMVEELVVRGAERIGHHEVLQKILQTEPDRLLPILVLQTHRLIAIIGPFLLLAMQRGEGQRGEGQRGAGQHDKDAEASAEYVARMLLSVIASPGSWDLSDRAQVRRLVQTQLLGGLL